jgi:hypothetical protein
MDAATRKLVHDRAGNRCFMLHRFANCLDG